jgi:hypothetical protein
MGEMRCAACGTSLAPRGFLSEPEVDEAALLADRTATRCPSCGLIQPADERTSRSALDVLRDAISGLDTLIGLLLMALLCLILGIWVIAPLSLAIHLLREGDAVRAALLVVLVATYTLLGARAAIRRELGPAAAAFGLMILAVVMWLAWRAP